MGQREADHAPTADALALRRDARLVGAMLGSLAGFKQQNSMCGLPLRLLREEVAVAFEEGASGERGGSGGGVAACARTAHHSATPPRI